ncbi:MAG: zinc ribbon domain-containing protein [Tepidisphaera sp.]
MITHLVSAIIPSPAGVLNEAWRSGPQAARSGLWTWLETPTRLGLGPSDVDRAAAGWAMGALVLSVLAFKLVPADGSSALGGGVPGAGVRRDLRLAAVAMGLCAAFAAAMGWTRRTHALGEAMVTLSPGIALLAGVLLIAVLLARKLGRVDRGACVGCGYPLPEPASRCPECGLQDVPDSEAAAQVSRPALFPGGFRVLVRGGAATALALACFHLLAALMPMPSVLRPSSVVTGTNTGVAGPAGGLRFVSWRTARAVASPWFVLEGPEWFRVAIVHRQQDQTGYACLAFNGDESKAGMIEGSFAKPPAGWVEISPASVRDLLARGGLTMTPEDEPVIHAMLLQMQANFGRVEGAPQVTPPNMTQGRSVLRTADNRRLEPTRFSVLALAAVSLLVGAGAVARGRAAA